MNYEQWKCPECNEWSGAHMWAWRIKCDTYECPLCEVRHDAVRFNPLKRETIDS